MRDIRNGIIVEIIDLLSWEEGMALANPCLSQVILLILLFYIYLDWTKPNSQKGFNRNIQMEI
jgi:hypothetical protein